MYYASRVTPKRVFLRKCSGQQVTGGSSLRAVHRFKLAPVFIAIVLVVGLTSFNKAHGGAARQYPASEAPRMDGGYFVEFRAREGLTRLGHAYVVYGRLDTQGRMVASQVIGFSDGDEQSVHLFSTRATIRPLKADHTASNTAIYRRRINAAQFREMQLKIRQVRRAQPPYHLIFLNCTDFAGEIAESIGLYRPPSLFPPRAYVVWLRLLNGP